MPDRMATVSVIVIAYNEERFVRRALDCVYSQSRVPDEVIFVDDGSTDETPSIVTQYPNVRYFRQKNQGPSSARNLGTKMAVGEIIAFLDVDDLWEEKKLEREVGLLEKDESIEIVQGLIVDVDEGEELSAGTELRVKVLSSPYPFVNLGSLAIRREVFQRVGEFDVDRRENEDTDWFLRAWENGIRKRIVNSVGLFYTIREGSLTGSKGPSASGLPSLLKQHHERSKTAPNLRPKMGLQEFFVAFPDRSKRRWAGDILMLRLKVRERNKGLRCQQKIESRSSSSGSPASGKNGDVGSRLLRVIVGL